MDARRVIKIAGAHLASLSGHRFDVLTLAKPVTPDAALNVAKILSKLSPLLGNLIEFNAVEGYQRPQWPDTGGAKQFHLEFMVDDLDKAADALRAAGAAQPQFQPGGARFRVLTDPAGHPFCIIDRGVAGAD